MRSWRRVFTSDEARIESLAGATPPEPFAPQSTPDMVDEPIDFNAYRNSLGLRDWPFPPEPPFRADDEALEEPNDA